MFALISLIRVRRRNADCTLHILHDALLRFSGSFCVLGTGVYRYILYVNSGGF